MRASGAEPFERWHFPSWPCIAVREDGVASARLCHGHPRLVFLHAQARRGGPAQGRAYRFGENLARSFDTPLPIDAVLDQLAVTLADNHAAVLVAPPGAG